MSCQIISGFDFVNSCNLLFWLAYTDQMGAWGQTHTHISRTHNQAVCIILRANNKHFHYIIQWKFREERKHTLSNFRPCYVSTRDVTGLMCVRTHCRRNLSHCCSNNRSCLTPHGTAVLNLWHPRHTQTNTLKSGQFVLYCDKVHLPQWALPAYQRYHQYTESIITPVYHMLVQHRVLNVRKK